MKQLISSSPPTLSWSATEPDLAPVGVAIRDLAHAVRIAFPLRGVESVISDLCDERIEVIDEERAPGVCTHIESRAELDAVWKAQDADARIARIVMLTTFFPRGTIRAIRASASCASTLRPAQHDSRYMYIVQQPEHAGHARHTFFVDDLDAIVTQIADRGLDPAKRETYSNGVRKTTYRDADGSEIGFGGAPR